MGFGTVNFVSLLDLSDLFGTYNVMISQDTPELSREELQAFKNVFPLIPQYNLSGMTTSIQFIRNDFVVCDMSKHIYENMTEPSFLLDFKNVIHYREKERYS